MAYVYWNQNNGQLTPISPTDLVGVGDSVAYDALSVVSPNSAGGLVVASKSDAPSIDSNTALMLHLDNNLTDSSLSPKSVTNSGVTFSNVVSKFGSYSANFNSASLAVVNGSAFNFGSNPFTIDYWMLNNHGISAQTHFIVALNANNLLTVYQNGGGQLQFVIYQGGTIICNYTVATSILTDSVWHHVAIVRNGTSVLIFVDGVSQTLTVGTAIGSSSIVNYTGPFRVGMDVDNYWIGNTKNFQGYMDEVRISNGIARWTSNFTPPTSAYTSTIAASTPYMKLGYVNGSAITQTAKIWTDSAASNALKINLGSATRLVMTDADIQFNGVSLLSAATPIWQDNAGVITPYTGTDVFSVGGSIVGCSDLMQVSANVTFSGVLTVGTGLTGPSFTTTHALTAGVITGSGMTVDSSGNMNLGTNGSITVIGNILKLTCANSGGNIDLGNNQVSSGGFPPSTYTMHPQIVSPATMSVAIGYNNSVNANNVTAFGQYCIVSGANATAISSQVSGAHAVGIGSLGYGDIGINAAGAIGLGSFTQTDVNSTNSIVIGLTTNCTNASSSVVIGSRTETVNGVSQYGCYSRANNSIVLGQAATTTVDGTNSMAFGYFAQACADNSMVIGGGVTYVNDGPGMTIPIRASAVSPYSMAVGNATSAQGVNSCVFGARANTSNDNAIAFGTLARGVNKSSIAIGYCATAGYDYNISLGYYSGRQNMNQAQITLSTKDSEYVPAVQMQIAYGVADFVANTVKAPALVLADTNPSSDVGSMYFDGTNFYGMVSAGVFKQLDNE